MARVVKGAEKEVEIMSTRSGVLAQTGSTLVKRGLYCAVLGRVHRVRSDYGQNGRHAPARDNCACTSTQNVCGLK